MDILRKTWLTKSSRLNGELKDNNDAMIALYRPLWNLGLRRLFIFDFFYYCRHIVPTEAVLWMLFNSNAKDLPLSMIIEIRTRVNPRNSKLPHYHNYQAFLSFKWSHFKFISFHSSSLKVLGIYQILSSIHCGIQSRLSNSISSIYLLIYSQWLLVIDL